MHPFARAVAEYAAARALFRFRPLVALSGGPDSSALLLALVEAADARLLPRPIGAAHFHHGMRGADADEDAAACEALAASVGVPCAVGRGALVSANEADARAARYAFLLETAARLHADTLVTGHTLDDQVETLLMRLLRGTSVDGLAGIPVRRALSETVCVVRPMRGLRRAEVLAYLADRGVAPRHDPTNDDPRYPRSRVRRLIPELAQEYNPELVAALGRLSEQAAADAALLNTLADGLWRDAVQEDPLRLDRVMLAAAAPALRGRVLLRALRRAGPDVVEERATGIWVARLEQLLRLHNHGRIDLPGGIKAVAEGTTLTLTPLPRAFREPLSIPGTVSLPDGRTLTARLGPPLRPDERQRRSATIDVAPLATDLIIRTAQDGDRMRVLGGAGRSKSVRELLRGARVPPEARAAWPLVASAETGEILWLVGVAQAESTRVPDGATEVLRLSVENSAR